MILRYRTTVVGNIDRKGISGGQRRRVSVAMEMMKEADMFLLDGRCSCFITRLTILFCFCILILCAYIVACLSFYIKYCQITSYKSHNTYLIRAHLWPRQRHVDIPHELPAFPFLSRHQHCRYTSSTKK